MPFNNNLDEYIEGVLVTELGLDRENITQEQLAHLAHALMRAFQVSAISPVDGRYGEDTKDLVESSSEGALISTRIEVEANYLIALSEMGIVRALSPDERDFLLQEASNIGIAEALEVKDSEATLNHDVLSMIAYLRKKVKGTSLEDLVENIHYGLTSEDINNISVRLMLKSSLDRVIIPNLKKIITWLTDSAEEYKDTVMLAQTHGQAAVGTTWGKELINFASRLDKELSKLVGLQLTGKINGAVGNYNALTAAEPGVNWINFSHNFISEMGLEPNLISTQINPYEDMIEVFQTLSRINGIIRDMDIDMWGYISKGWLIQEVKAGEAGSSAMPQKVNPIRFENSEGNTELANGVFGIMSDVLAVSRFQRDLTDSTVVRNVGVSIAHTKLVYKSVLGGLGRIKPNTELMKSELNKDWSVLAEAAQTLMRKHNVADSYEKMKKLVRGVHTTEVEWKQRLAQLDIPRECHQEILALTPELYTGQASFLTERAVAMIRERASV